MERVDSADDEMQLDGELKVDSVDDQDDDQLSLEVPTRSTAVSHDSSVEPGSSVSTESFTQLTLALPQRKKKRSDASRMRTAQLGSSSSSSSSGTGSSGSGSFPTPFKCCGDFCDFIIQQILTGEPGISANRSPVKPHIARFESNKGIEASTALALLFSSDERQIVGDQRLQQLLESVQVARWDDPHAQGRSIKAATSVPVDNSNARDLRIITYKSIALAKPNKHHLMTMLRSKETRSLEENSPTALLQDGAKAQTRKRSSLMDPTLSYAIREGYRARVYGEMEGVANHYREVRVCRNCYAIYTLLDRARELAVGQNGLQGALDTQLALRRSTVKAKWNAMVDERVDAKEKLFLRHRGEKPSADREDTTLISATSAPLLVLPVSSSSSSILPAICSPKNSAVCEEDMLSPQLVGVKISSTLPAFNSHLVTKNKDIVNAAPIKTNGSVVSMDKYLRGESKQIQVKELREGHLFRGDDGKTSKPSTSSKTSRRRTPASSHKPIASVLLLDSDLSVLQFIHDTLTHAAASSLPFSLEIESLTDSSEALRAVKDAGYDLILVARELAPTATKSESQMNGLEFTKLVRQREVQRSVSSSSKPWQARTPILCLSDKTTPTDLQLFREAGMDGCIGKPINTESLVQTVHAALSKTLSAASTSCAVSTATDAIAKAKLDQQEKRKRRRRKLEAATTLPFPGLLQTDVRDYTHGTFQMDSETSFPYCVLGDKTLIEAPSNEKNTFFNLVIIHDLFDTWERLQILLNPIVTRYKGAVQILVWNYPGQAYTTWRAGTVLNNTYHCQCFQALLNYVGTKGRGFLRDAPYYLLGLGNGGNIATLFGSQSPPFDLNTRALILVNSFTHVDAPLAQFLHDSLKVFSCTPESRPDLPVYFHTRFLFSPSYLARVTTPLALNLYTAVMNPLTLDGRKALCQGALNHCDLRKNTLTITVPFVSICASQDALVNVAMQAQSLVDATRVLLVDSIGKVLRAKINSKKTSSVVWLASGHEVLQECKAEMLMLLEQLVTGYHELNDVPHQSAIAPSAGMMAGPSSPKKLTQAAMPSSLQNGREEIDAPARAGKKKKTPATSVSYEDTFIDRVLTTVNQVVPSPSTASPSNQLTSPEKSKWLAFQTESETTATQAQQGTLVTHQQNAARVTKQRRDKQIKESVTHMTSWDPTTPAFERLSTNLIYKIGDGSKIYPDNKAMPEVKEYMAWRVQRNQKRLRRMDDKVRVIQRAFRAFFARTMAWRLQRERCAVQLQRHWRAKMARSKYKGMQKEEWAVRLVQRQWRGKMGRNNYKERMQKYLAAREIQRIMRGALAVRFVTRIRRRMHTSATNIQRLIRRYLAKRRMFWLRRRRNAAITIERVFRGHLGRKRFQHEKDKYLFSKTQTQGITFGKQMLMEYKLYGTKLQSEVALLTATKSQVEIDAETIVKEICEFEEGIRVLEMEMHALAQLETEGLSKQMDEQAKWQLREQKMRLDREFTQMLSQIATRKEKLNVMEEKLQHLDKERLAKEEELKSLEKKLVILLEEQQQELDKIKHKQQSRSQLLLDILPPHGAGSPMGSPWTTASSVGSRSSGGASSPSKSAVQTAAANSTSAFSTQQREEANSLMESTETMMKFGFMSMSMTYFSSMNMVRAMRKIGAHHMTLDSAAVVSNHKWPEYNSTTSTGSAGASPMGFQPAVPAGSFPGQQPLQVAGWSVADVGRWLDTLALGQYKRAFQDAAVDGALLLHLNDEDLKNTLGMEHRLHRKKVTTSVEQLREAERIKMKRLYGAHNPDEMPSGSSAIGSPISPSRAAVAAPSPMPSASAFPSPTRSAVGSTPSPREPSAGGNNSKMLVSFADFCTLVRHGKLKQIKEALAHLPERKFDPLTVATQNAPGVGTLYDDLLEKSVFHINKGDENGNTPLLLAAQNNSLKVVQYLISKGANPNHQNKHGQTAGHYAMAYSFFDLGAWLLDPEKGGGRDDIANENGLTAYDGIA